MSNTKCAQQCLVLRLEAGVAGDEQARACAVTGPTCSSSDNPGANCLDAYVRVLFPSGTSPKNSYWVLVQDQCQGACNDLNITLSFSRISTFASPSEVGAGPLSTCVQQNSF